LVKGLEKKDQAEKKCNNYYPFGMQMPGRTFSSGNYRYGYQGSEKDDEISGQGNTYTTHYRGLDVRLGRWLSTDPVVHPHLSPYNSMYNNPIIYNDVYGNCPPCIIALAYAIIEVAAVSTATALVMYGAWQVAGSVSDVAYGTHGVYESVAESTGVVTLPPPAIPMPDIDITDVIPDGVYLESEAPDNEFSPEPNPVDSPKPFFRVDPQTEDEEKKEYYIHYTNSESFAEISQTKALRSNEKGKVYLTKAFLTPTEVENLLFGAAKPGEKTGNGDYMFVFEVDADQELGITKVNDLEYTYNFGTLRIRVGNLKYEGENVVEDLKSGN